MICRSVIHQNDLYLLLADRLTKKLIYALSQISTHIITGNHDTDRFHLNDHPPYPEKQFLQFLFMCITS